MPDVIIVLRNFAKVFSLLANLITLTKAYLAEVTLAKFIWEDDLDNFGDVYMPEVIIVLQTLPKFFAVGKLNNLDKGLFS